MCLHFDQIAHGDDVWDSLSSACTSMWSLWKLFYPVKQWLKISESINWALFSKAKPFRSPRLISLNSFRNVATHRKVFAPFLFVAFDRQNEYKSFFSGFLCSCVFFFHSFLFTFSITYRKVFNYNTCSTRAPWIWNDLNGPGAPRLVGYLSLHMQHALVE